VIYTFYSFKGGVGRSMALANIADRLARRGLRVLAIDFDLEAPGLERYYPVDNVAALDNCGLIDLLRDFKSSLAGQGESIETARFRDLSRFVFPIYEQVGEGGRLDLLTAGCRSPGEGLRRYALDVRTFDWQDFYYNWEGEAFFEWLRKALIGPFGRYDAVLVDSRTGVTEMGGVCAYQLADAVVMMSAANHQNLLGTQDVARDFRSASVMSLRRGRPLELVVIPSRIEQGNQALLDAFFSRFNETFGGEMPAVLAGLSSQQLAIPYEPEYAFEEVVVTDPARRHRPTEVSSAYERLTDALVMLGTGPKIWALQAAARQALWPTSSVTEPSDDGDETAPVVNVAAATLAGTPLQYDPSQRFASYDGYLSRGTDSAVANALADALQARDISVFVDNSALVDGDDWSAAATQALHHSRALLLCVDAGGISAWQKKEVEYARNTSQPLKVLPVLLHGADPQIFALSLKGVADLQAIDLRGWPERQVEFELLVQQLSEPRATESSASNVPTFNPYAGLAPGDERHAGLLDLPAAELAALVEGLQAQNFMVLHGPSGAGKTTLIASGLVPAVRSGTWGSPSFEIERVDLRESPGWLDAFELPGPHTGPRLTIVDHVDEGLAGLPDPGSEGLLHLTWLKPLQALVGATHANWRVLLVARFPLPGLGERAVALMAGTAPHERPRLDIPALRTGMAFEPGLLARLDDDVAHGRQCLTLGQLVLPGLWDGARRGFLGNEAYAASGGVAAVYERHVSAVLARVPDEIEPAAHGLLLWLLQGTGEAGWAWRGSTWRRITQLRSYSAPTVTALFWLVRERVLHLELKGNVPYVTLVMPLSLAPVSCAAIRQLLDEHGPKVRLRGALSFALERWRKADENEIALLTGQALRDAETLVADWDAHLTQDMLRFVEASQQSVAAADTVNAAQARRRTRLGISAFVGALAVIFTVLFFYQRSEKLLFQKTIVLSQELQAAKFENTTATQTIAYAGRIAAAVAQVSQNGKGDVSLNGLRVAVFYDSTCEAAVARTVATTLSALGASVEPPQRGSKPEGSGVFFSNARDRADGERLQSLVSALLHRVGVDYTPGVSALPADIVAPRGSLELWLPALSRAAGVPVRGLAQQTGRDGSDMRLVSASCATLGSDRETRMKTVRDLGVNYFNFLDNDQPPTQRWVDAFYIQRTEVTNAQFANYVKEECAGAGGAPASTCPAGWKARGADNEPARFLSWSAADAYCRWIGGRLPTEEEWEKAARGTDGRIWPWGNEPDPARFQGLVNSKQRLSAVGRFPRGDSPYGVADLAGNLWELTASPWPGGGHVMKGGSYLNDLAYVRASSRWSSGDEEVGSYYLGFRCVTDTVTSMPAAPERASSAPSRSAGGR